MITTLYLSPVQANLCTEAYQSDSVKVDSLVPFKIREGKKLSLNEVIGRFKAISKKQFSEQTSTRLFLVQTAMVMKQPTPKVIEKFEQFENSGYEKNEIGHSVVFQTIMLSGRSKNEVKQFFRENENNSSWTHGSPANVMALQTAFLTGRPVAEVIKFFENFPQSGQNVRSLNHWVIAQTAFMFEISPNKVIQYFREFDYIPGESGPGGQHIIAQTYLGQETPN